jgi:hypothetical protein
MSLVACANALIKELAGLNDPVQIDVEATAQN